MSQTARYILKRLLIGVLVVLCVSLVIFGILQAMPGDPVELMTSPRVSQDKDAEIRARWGLDQHWHDRADGQVAGKVAQGMGAVREELVVVRQGTGVAAA